MAPRDKKKRKNNEKRQSMASDGLRLIQTLSLSANPPPFKCPTPTPPIRQNLAIKFRQISYVFTFFSTNTYLNGTYYISKLSEKYKEFYSIKSIPVFESLRKFTRGWWVIRHRKPPPFIHSLDSLNGIKWNCSYMSSGTEIYELSK